MAAECTGGRYALHATSTGARSVSLAGACPSSRRTAFSAASVTLDGVVISMPMGWPSVVKSMTSPGPTRLVRARFWLASRGR